MVSDRVRLELLRFVREVVGEMAWQGCSETRQACLSTLALISWKQMRAEGKDGAARHVRNLRLDGL